jgi:serralysin
MTTLADLENYVFSAPQSGVASIDALLNDFNAWVHLAPSTGNTVYYTFSITSGTKPGDTGIVAFNTSQKEAARQVMAHAATVTGIQFVETADGSAADIHFATKDLERSGYCTYDMAYSLDHTNTVVSLTYNAYVYLNKFKSTMVNPESGSEGYQVLLHEVGHALGLKHPFESSSEAPGKLASSLDNTDNTVMSYTWTGAYKTTFQSYDLAALAYLYGGDGLGGTNYSVSSSSGGGSTIGGGSTGGSTGDGGNNKLTGTTANDQMFGYAGNDKLNGGDGDDILIGGEGIDMLTGGSGADAFVFDNFSSSGASAADKITDFKVSEGDKFSFDTSIFTSLAGGIAAGNVVIAAKVKASEADDFILMTTKGKLYYDADGSGSGAAVLIAGVKGSFTSIDFTSFVIE